MGILVRTSRRVITGMMGFRSAQAAPSSWSTQLESTDLGVKRARTTSADSNSRLILVCQFEPALSSSVVNTSTLVLSEIRLRSFLASV